MGRRGNDRVRAADRPRVSTSEDFCTTPRRQLHNGEPAPATKGNHFSLRALERLRTGTEAIPDTNKAIVGNARIAL